MERTLVIGLLLVAGLTPAGVGEVGDVGRGSGNYLIVAAEGYVGSAPLIEFADAKAAMGFNVSVYSVPSGTSRADIKAYIENWYTPGAAGYVLIVGDTSGAYEPSTATTIPHWEGQASRHADTDLPYACMDGPDDWWPEIFIGRFSVTTVEMLQNVVNKSLFVEAGIYPDPTYLNRAVLLAASDILCGAEQTHEWVIENYLEPAGFSVTRVYAGQGGDTADIAAAVNAGCLFTNYFGHSTSGGWWSPMFADYDVYDLVNTGLYGLVFGFSCDTAKFSYGECVGETWLRAADRGAAAYLSASAYVFYGSWEQWESSRLLEKYFYESFFVDNIWEVGPAWQAALYDFLDDYGADPANTDIVRNFFEEMVLLGDPALRLLQNDFSLSTDPTAQELCVPPADQAVYLVAVAQHTGFAEPITLAADGLPDGASVTFSVNDAPPPFTTVMTIDNLDGAAAGEYELRITGNTAGGMQRQTVARLSIIRNLPAPVTLRSPANGECDVHCMSLLIWEAASTATTYELEVATDSGFADVVHAVTVSRTRHRVDPPLDALTSYYWRVRAVNDCGAGPYSPVFGFTTPAWTGSVLRVPAEQTTIQAAIDAAQDGDVVLVADGTYKGTGNRDLHVDGKAITVCSTGGPELCVIACENAGVGFILASGETAATVVDGFTIRAGNCFYSGGGILIAGSSPTISDCHILDNWARLDGGGIYCTDGNPLIVDCTFSGNNVRYGGGGLFCDNDSDVTLIGCTFSRNIAGYYAGGGVASYDGALTITDSTIAENRINGGHNYSGGGGLCCSNTTLVLTNCRVLGNTAGSTGYHGCGGGIMCNNGNAVVTACTFSLNQARSGGGGIALSGTDSASIADCTITGNRASYGGGTYCRGAGTTNVVNCAITGNMAYYSGGGVYCEDTVFVNCTIADNATMSPFGGGVYCHCDGVYSELVNCIVWDNNPDGLFADGDDLIVRYCDLQGGWPGLGNIDADPFFVAAGHWEDPATPSDPWDDVWVAGDYHLTAESPCVNRGDNEAPGLPAQDLDGQPRIQMCRVDMGVDETPHIGSDCNENGVADACDVEQGTSPDCNDNLVPDECDVASGSSPDTNANGVPDECEVCPGDSNCDGHVDWRDIEYFLAALVSEHEWECRFSETPPCPYLNNDVNADGAVTWKDVDPLVVLMNTTCPRGRR